MKKIQVFLPDKDIKQLKDESNKLGISLSEIIRRIVSKYMESKST